MIVKLHGTTSANPVTGQLTTTFDDQPQQPFELLQLKLKGGPRATLANPQSCGPAVTSADLTPWSAPGLGGPSGTEPFAGTPDATPSSSFNVDLNGAGGACPGALPFNPSFNAGTTGAKATTAGAYTGVLAHVLPPGPRTGPLGGPGADAAGARRQDRRYPAVR